MKNHNYKFPSLTRKEAKEMKEFWDQYEFPFDPSEDGRRVIIDYHDGTKGETTLGELRVHLREETPHWIEDKFKELKESGKFTARFCTYSFQP